VEQRNMTNRRTFLAQLGIATTGLVVAPSLLLPPKIYTVEEIEALMYPGAVISDKHIVIDRRGLRLQSHLTIQHCHITVTNPEIWSWIYWGDDVSDYNGLLRSVNILSNVIAYPNNNRNYKIDVKVRKLRCILPQKVRVSDGLIW